MLPSKFVHIAQFWEISGSSCSISLFRSQNEREHVYVGKHARERLLASTASAWAHVAQKGIGLFSGVWSPQAAPLSSGDLREWDAHAEDASLISALHAHHLWTLSLLEFWEASKHELGASPKPGDVGWHQIVGYDDTMI